MTNGAKHRTTFWLNVAAIMERADEQVLPAVYLFAGRSLGASLRELGGLTAARALVQALVSPVSGMLGDRYSRTSIVAAGCYLWAAMTALIGLSTTLAQAMACSALNGIGLALVIPCISSLVADVHQAEERGRAFGTMALVSSIGGMGASVFATSIGGRAPWGVEGWRLAFLAVAIASAATGLAVQTSAVDPRAEAAARRRPLPDDNCDGGRYDGDGGIGATAGHPTGSSSSSSGGGEGHEHLLSEEPLPPGSARKQAGGSSGGAGVGGGANGDGGDRRTLLELRPQGQPLPSLGGGTRDSADAGGETPQGVGGSGGSKGGKGARGPAWGLLLELRRAAGVFSDPDVRSVLRVRTFQVLILQGVVGTMPWMSLTFLTLYLQLLGFTDSDAASLVAVFGLGCAMGSLLGGIIGDRASRTLPNSGRILANQLSVALGLPLSVMLFKGLPWPATSTSASVSAASRAVWPWYAAALVVYGLSISWCGCNNSAIFSEVVPERSRSKVYAFDRAFEGALGAAGLPLVGMAAENLFGFQRNMAEVTDGAGRLRNASALSSAMLLCLIVPWLGCLAFQTGMYWTYPKDRRAAKLSKGEDHLV